MNKEEAIEFAIFVSKWCFNNSSFEFHELDEETQDEIFQEFLRQKKEGDKLREEVNGFKNLI
jgi:hypothetical protein